MACIDRCALGRAEPRVSLAISENSKPIVLWQEAARGKAPDAPPDKLRKGRQKDRLSNCLGKSLEFSDVLTPHCNRLPGRQST